jgi:hypothetical protein
MTVRNVNLKDKGDFCLSPPDPQLGGMSETAGRKRRDRRPTLDGRTREAALKRRVSENLLRHLGEASAVQRQLVDRAAMLTVHIELFDRRALASGGLDQGDAREYLDLNNSLVRILRQLGLKGAAPKVTSLAELIRNRAGQGRQMRAQNTAEQALSPAEAYRLMINAGDRKV